MITKASELLAAFIEKEVQKLEGFEMRHMPTLGSAYEAIAKTGLDQKYVLPPGLDLRVVSGFIDGLDNQFDCMLVQGPGQRYGLTDQYIYPIEKTLCVFEVKKNLTKAELADAIEHLASVQRLFGTSFVQRYEAKEIRPDFKRTARSFAQITGRKGPENIRTLGAMQIDDRAMFGLLVRQQYAPVTVLFGFGGYTTEHGLRKGLLDILESQAGKTSSASVDLMPTLITANSHSLVKCNHQPYLIRRHDWRWVLLASTRHNPARILLELIWSKISNYCDVRMPWGDDMEMETLKELLIAEALIHGDTFGWKYTSFEYAEKKLQRPEMLEWEPATLGPAAMSIVKLIGAHGGCLAMDESIASYLSKT
ncbi:DUF6602 domain-containing protein, partial [Candidatus Methylomirabilis sp.]|uniref:DUF6602 domain-containing protein n=1 Tax=Candidatus Methylomirabilis sp. TaxID=2032687 RepID=UPI003C7215C2